MSRSDMCNVSLYARFSIKKLTVFVNNTYPVLSYLVCFGLKISMKENKTFHSPYMNRFL